MGKSAEKLKSSSIVISTCNPTLRLGQENCYTIKANLGYVSRTMADRAG